MAYNLISLTYHLINLGFKNGKKESSEFEKARQ